MERLTYLEFVAARAEFDRVAMGAGLSGGSCWLSPWQLSAHGALHGGEVLGDGSAGGWPGAARRHLIYRSEHAWGAWVESDQPGVFLPFEPVWMFASPLVGEPGACAALAAQVFLKHRAEIHALVVGGIPAGSELHRGLRGLLRVIPGVRIGEAEGTESCLVDLRPQGGVSGLESWLSRRSRNFRRSVRRARLLDSMEVVDGLDLDPLAAFERMLAVQERSHKAREGDDIFALADYRDFYRRLLLDVHGSGELRMSLVRDGDAGVDVAFHFGFARGEHYRGYQMSYAEEVRPHGVGTALQMRHLRRAAAEGVTRYDMGMLAAYKERWCDRIERGVVLVMQ